MYLYLTISLSALPPYSQKLVLSLQSKVKGNGFLSNSYQIRSLLQIFPPRNPTVVTLLLTVYLRKIQEQVGKRKKEAQ